MRCKYSIVFYSSLLSLNVLTAALHSEFVFSQRKHASRPLTCTFSELTTNNVNSMTLYILLEYRYASRMLGYNNEKGIEQYLPWRPSYIVHISIIVVQRFNIQNLTLHTSQTSTNMCNKQINKYINQCKVSVDLTSGNLVIFGIPWCQPLSMSSVRVDKLLSSQRSYSCYYDWDKWYFTFNLRTIQFHLSQ